MHANSHTRSNTSFLFARGDFILLTHRTIDISCSIGIIFVLEEVGFLQPPLYLGLRYRRMSNITTVVFPERFDWYMIRNGFLGPDYSSKIGSFIIAVVLILYDGLTRKRLDYLWAMIVGTALWVLLEWCLIVSGVREYQEGYLGGKLLGFWPALIIRCSQECGFLMVSTMFQGDRLFNCMKGKKSPFKTWRRMVEFIVVFLLLSLSGTVNMLSGAKDERMVGSAEVFGRRNMTHIVSVLLFLITTIVPIIICIVLRNKKYFMRRTIGITLFITWTSGLGMVIEYTHNARWIEVGYYPEYVALPTSGHMLLAFLYDLIIEVVSPPVFIYHLMVLCYILPDLKKDTYYDEKPAVELPVTKQEAAVNVPAPTEAPVFKGPEDLLCVC